MNRRFIVGALVTMLIGIGLTAYLSQDYQPASGLTRSKKELAAKYAEVAARLGQTDMNSGAALVPIDLNHKRQPETDPKGD